MGWHASGILIRVQGNKTPADCVREMGFEGYREVGVASLDDATSYRADTVMCAKSNGWFYLVDPEMFYGLKCEGAPSEPLGIWPSSVDERIQKMRWDVVSYMLAGSVGMAGFAIYQHGRLVRAYLSEDYEVRIDYGTASTLEEEVRRGEGDDEEQFVLELMEQLTGHMEAFEESEFIRFER